MSDQGGYQSFSSLQSQRDLQERLRMIELQLFTGTAETQQPDSTNVSLGRLEFSYSDVHQRQLCLTSNLITRVVLVILEAFDDANATLSVGDDADPQRLLSADSSDLTIACSFASHPNYDYQTETAVSLFLQPGSSTAGRGVVLVYAD